MARKAHRSAADYEEEIARLRQEVDRLTQEVGEGSQRETATSEVLRVIASSPTEVQPVLDAVAESAMHLTQSSYAGIFRLQVDGLRCVSVCGSLTPEVVGHVYPLDRTSLAGRAVLEQRVVYVSDLTTESDEEFSSVKRITDQLHLSVRTSFVVPLMREGGPIGALTVGRTQVLDYTDAQTGLLKTFADQAAIARNSSQELEQRNAELTESLERQTATAEILRVI